MQQVIVKNLYSWDTVYSADSVEWCPIHPHQELLACGTYQIESSDEVESQKNYKRLGRLYLFKVDICGLHLVEQLELPAILDLKWCHVSVNSKVLLAVANAHGEVLIYELRDPRCDEDAKGDTSMLNLIAQKSFHCRETDAGETLMLSLDWSTGRTSIGREITNSASLVVSDSRGRITVLEFAQDTFVASCSWKAHGFEAWIAAFDYWNTSVIYTGGDDSKMHMFDKRIGTSTPIQSSGAHDAGVTSLHCSAVTENLLVSGSYDENLRSWDTRALKNPVTTTPLGGGVWRLKWDPRHWRYLLAACMSNGFQVVGCPQQTEPPTVVATYQEHESLAYGADWCHLSLTESRCRMKLCQDPQPEDAILVATCSFYDHKLHVSCIYNFPH